MSHVHGHRRPREERRAERADTGEGRRRKGKLVLPIDTPMPKTSAFTVPDGPEGMPKAGGGNVHGGLDWFGPGGTPVKSPVNGKIVEVQASKGNTGQVFGGVVKVQDDDGRVYVFRHVDPTKLREGQSIRAGQKIAEITDWQGGGSHAHIEVWKSLRGGYNFENAIDPLTVFKNGGVPANTTSGPGSEGMMPTAAGGSAAPTSGATGSGGAAAAGGGGGSAPVPLQDVSPNSTGVFSSNDNSGFSVPAGLDWAQLGQLLDTLGISREEFLRLNPNFRKVKAGGKTKETKNVEVPKDWYSRTRSRSAAVDIEAAGRPLDVQSPTISARDLNRALKG